MDTIPLIAPHSDRTTLGGLDDYLQRLGPLRALLEDDAITEIMVRGADDIFIERRGTLELTDLHFRDENHVVDVIQVIVSSVGRRIDAHQPVCEARLLDGSRLAASIPPVAVNGPLLTIRKLPRDPFGAEDLIRLGTLTEATAAILEAYVRARANVIISGGTGSGKTTLLRVCSDFIPAGERIVIIEDAAELQLRQPHVCSLEAQSPDPDGRGGVSIRDLVAHSLRMRPDRIIVGECRGGEALDMLQAMNTGHDGSLSTLHANTARDCVARLETLVLLAGVELPIRAIRQQISSAVDVVVQIARLRDGSRKVTSITELWGTEGETMTMQDIFTLDVTGAAPDGRLITELKPSGFRPRVVAKLHEQRIPVPPPLARLFPTRGAA
ncbi:MAG TPA: CpaF family protein [Candidatus Dormibacteraeota bacterium]|nr:CpaF family protein [Candidatus Dormibacteraeota bacterium]